MRVSVIIPVRNNAAGLQLCLEALRNQTYPAESFEVIVVDNASTDEIGKVKVRFPHVRWLADAGSGSYSARNCGLSHATGDIVAFTDSDCIPTPSWLQNGVATLDAKRGTIIGGNVDMIDPVGRNLNVYELIEIAASGLPDSKRLVEERGFTTTGNLITYRENFSRWGVFDATLKSAGDREWVTRAVQHGEKLVYADEVMVRHPRRSSFRPLLMKYRRQVGGRMALLKRTHPSARQILAELFLFSLFDPHTYAMARNPKVTGLGARIHLFEAILLMSVMTTLERFRVLLGGSGYRG